MVALRSVAVGLLALVLAGCGGDASSSPQLVDGSDAGVLPAALEALDGAVMTRTVVKPASEIDETRLAACGVPATEDTPVVERTGVQGASLTFVGGGPAVIGCSAIADPVEDADRPFGGVWCAVSLGFRRNGALRDPRLSLCTGSDGSLTAFAWVEPRPQTRWVVVSGAGQREVYEVAVSLPVRVSTTDHVEPEGSAAFDVAEYGADGSMIHEYTLEAVVAG